MTLDDAYNLSREQRVLVIKEKECTVNGLYIYVKLVYHSDVVTQEEQTHLSKAFLYPNLVRRKIQSTTKNQWTSFTENQ